MSSEPRVLIVSNRLPVTIQVSDGRVSVEQASGGVATGVGDYHKRSGGLWLGWPGDLAHLTPAQRTEADQMLFERHIAAVHLSAQEVRQYYEGFSNGVLWPLFHYLLDRIPLGVRDWEVYRAVNEKFADRVAQHYRPGDLIWVHDYQLTLVPALLRRRIPDARIGFFLHIPFPSSEVFRILPWRREILEGLLGADLVGFHTYSYVRHFAMAVLDLLGLEPDVDRVRVGHRQIRLGVYPMGVDAQAYGELASEPAVSQEAALIRQEAGGRHILLGVDRLDYTKGIPRRLVALERLFEQKPELRDRIRLIQVAVPSRTTLESYRGFRKRVEELVGRINGAHGSVRSVPIHYLYRSIPSRELVALYRAADVMLITPLRDGMNLVAKEFVASRVDEDGVLILSEFAGAASEFGEAVIVNPYDVNHLATVIQQALTMNPAERRARMRGLRRRVIAHDVHHWAERFVRDLAKIEPADAPATRAFASLDRLAGVVDTLRQAPRLALILDYDGTLVPLASAPELAVPDAALLVLLRALAARPNTTVSLVSGRDPETLEQWFGDLPIALSAEHGFWTRLSPALPWEPYAPLPTESLGRIRPILEQFAESTPGSLVEEKSASLAWHYRLVDPAFGARQAHEIRMLLGDALSNQPLEVMEGKKVVEVRLRGVNKALVVQRVLGAEQPPSTILAVGDDRTDEDLFAALPEESISVHVGGGDTRATVRVPDWTATRSLLLQLLPESPSRD